jgi:CBS domain-containing protein
MRVTDIMQTNLWTVRGDDTVADAVALMAENHVSGLPVIDPHGRLVGVLSSSDVLEAEAESGGKDDLDRLFNETLVRDIMTPRPQTLTVEATIKEAAQRLLYLEIHRLFIEQEGKLVGVVSTSDLVRAMALEKKA